MESPSKGSAANRILKTLGNYGTKRYLMRLVTALFLCWIVVVIIADVPFAVTMSEPDKVPVNPPEIYKALGFPLFLVCTAGIFVLLCLVPSDTVIYVMLFASAGIYLMYTAYGMADYLFSVGLCGVMSILVVYFGVRIPKRDPGGLTTKIILGVFIAAFTVFVGGICCLFVLNYMTHCYDFGLFSQMFHYMKETGECLVTCERDKLLNHFAVHFSPIYYLILPFYMIFPHPCTLVVAQALIVASGVIPLVLLTKHYGMKNLTAVLFSAVYLLYPAFLGGCFFYLHENCFLPPLLLWFFYLSEKGYMWRVFLVALLTLLVKEDAAVYVTVCAVYFVLSKKNVRTNLICGIFAVVYFIAVTKLMGVYGEGIMTDTRYGDYVYDGGGLFTVIKAVIQNPVYAVAQIFREEKLLFMLQVSVPLCFLPFAVKRPSKLVLFIPLILVNLMTGYEYQYDIGYQYVFGSGAILIYLAVSNYGEMGTGRRKALACAVLSSAIIFSGGYFKKQTYYSEYKEQSYWRETMRNALEMIPEGKSVAATSLLVTMLSQRDELYMLEYTEREADIIAIDLRFGDTGKYVVDCKINDFREIIYIDGVVAIYERVE